MANADTPEDALAARNNGAQGIGLCRTEHMVCIYHLLVTVQYILGGIHGDSTLDFLCRTVGVNSKNPPF
jgi:hypothetical protein